MKGEKIEIIVVPKFNWNSKIIYTKLGSSVFCSYTGSSAFSETLKNIHGTLSKLLNVL